MPLRETRSSLIATLIGLVVNPFETVPRLFLSKPPPHAIALLLIAISTVVVPHIAQIIKYGYISFDSPQFFALVVAALGAFLAFLCLELGLLVLIRTRITPHELFHCMTYSLVPLTFFLWVIYAYNVITGGRLTIVSYLQGAGGGPTPALIAFMPWGTTLCIVWMGLVFFLSVRELNKESQFGVGLLTALSGVPLFAATLLGALLGEMIHRGFFHTFASLFGAS